MVGTRVLKRIHPDYLVPDATDRLESSSESPLLATRGVYSLHRLRRRTRSGEWRTLGYGVWSVMTQYWVVGGWESPASFSEAYGFLAAD